MLTSQAVIMGPMSLNRGNCTGPILRPASRIRSRFEDRYPAKKMASVILAISPGWKVMEPILIQTLAPRTSPAEMPGTSGRMRSTALMAREI